MACATLYVVAQVLQSKKCANTILTRSEIGIKVETETIELDNEKSKAPVEEQKPSRIEDSIVLSNVRIEPEEISEVKEIKPTEVFIKSEFDKFKSMYDPYNRNPLRAGANASFYTELAALSLHFHPSVALFANCIINGEWFLSHN